MVCFGVLKVTICLEEVGSKQNVLMIMIMIFFQNKDTNLIAIQPLTWLRPWATYIGIYLQVAIIKSLLTKAVSPVQDFS